MREQLLCYALRYEGDWKKMKLALDRQEPWTRMAYEGLSRQAAKACLSAVDIVL